MSRTARRGGRPPKPPSHHDALSEALVDVFCELNALSLDRKKFEQRYRAAEHRMAGLLRDAWNHSIAIHPVHGGDVIPMPGGGDREAAA